MYLNIGNNILLNDKDILAVFDLDNTSQSHRTRAYLRRAEQAGQVTYTNIEEIPKSFLVCAGRNRHEQRVYISTLNSQTIAARLGRL
ncbi:MAG: DUF370 domain-containing protein [Clostridiales bacterium]|nr:DUF370 domain-containing protein [Clostridiales bacterium]